MTCDIVTMPGGGRAIVCHKHKPQRCRCGQIATLLCDWKLQFGTCDAALCERCTTSPTAGKDLCAKHAHAWRQRQATVSIREGDAR